MEDKKELRKQTLYEYAEAKTALAELRGKSFNLGRELAGLGNTLQAQDQITNLALETYALLLSKETHDTIKDLIAKTASAENELARLSDKMRDYGYASMVS